ncbi:MAG: hypothetical protein KKD07_06665 [Candidatus Omnitrophica bacterium]|nr:hypothetical protein [Candidatus Omnitrophota bacterium]MBU1996571.1 hypothetical protein [Candidatus Omnitrophota bacterium]MBU4334105.1 hypothetical protein [Candidatus Omnitrophota bacterium]
MGKSGKKPRQKLNSKSFEPDSGSSAPKKKERDWDFDDIARSKTPRR